MKRIRIKFSKDGALRYTSHLDLHSIWERSVRRAGLPLVYSQGFHPQPKIQLAAALALGFISHAEIVDIWLKDDDSWQTDELQARIQKGLPDGVQIQNVQEVDLRGPALQTQVHTAEYEVTLLDEMPVSLLDEKIDSVLAAESLPREKRKQRKHKRYTTQKPTYDLRPLILNLEILTPSPSSSGRGEQQPHIFMRLSAREGATGRPDDVLSEMGIPIEAARVVRTRLVYE